MFKFRSAVNTYSCVGPKRPQPEGAEAILIHSRDAICQPGHVIWIGGWSGPQNETTGLDSNLSERRIECEIVSKKVTKEFKEAAIRRLELGASLAEVARGCEVDSNVLHRWRRELRQHGIKAFPGEGHSRVEESRLAELERKVGRQAMEIDFCGDACSMSRSSGSCRR